MERSRRLLKKLSGNVSLSRQEMEASIEDYQRQTALYEQAAARLQEQNGVLYGRYTALEERYADLGAFISDIDGQFIANYRGSGLRTSSGATFNSTR